MDISRRPLVSNVIWLLIDRGGRLLIAFLTGIWIARQLGPETFGALTYAQATIGLLGFMSLFAIEAIVVRMLVDEPQSAPEILGTALLLRAAGGVSAVAASLIAVRFFQMNADVRVIVPLLSCALVFQSMDVADYWFRRNLLSRYGVAARTLALIVGSGLRIWAAGTAEPLLTLSLAIIAESVLIASLLWLALRMADLKVVDWRPSWLRARSILEQSGPMLLSAIAVSIYVRFGFVLLGEARGAYEVGQLAVASTIAEALHVIPIAVAASYGPILLGTRAQSHQQFETGFYKLLRGFIALGIAMAGIVALSANWLVPFAFGESYRESGHILVLLVGSVVFVYISIASELWLVGKGLQRFILPKTLIAAACYVPLALWIIPRYGARGAAITTLVTYSISAYWTNSIFTATRPLFRFQTAAFFMVSHKSLSQNADRLKES